MFVKLMKYEMMSTARVFGVCYLALLAVSLLLLIPFHGALINGFDTDFSQAEREVCLPPLL